MCIGVLFVLFNLEILLSYKMCSTWMHLQEQLLQEFMLFICFKVFHILVFVLFLCLYKQMAALNYKNGNFPGTAGMEFKFTPVLI